MHQVLDKISNSQNLSLAMTNFVHVHGEYERSVSSEVKKRKWNHTILNNKKKLTQYAHSDVAWPARPCHSSSSSLCSQSYLDHFGSRSCPFQRINWKFGKFDIFGHVQDLINLHDLDKLILNSTTYPHNIMKLLSSYLVSFVSKKTILLC